MTIVIGIISPGPKPFSIQSKPTTVSKPSSNSAKLSYVCSPLKINKIGAVISAIIPKDKIGRVQVKCPKPPQSLLSLCSAFLSNGQNNFFPNTTRIKRTIVLIAIVKTDKLIDTEKDD